MGDSFSVMNVAFYVAFTAILTLWTISIICRRYRTYYSPSTHFLTGEPLHPLARAQAAIPHHVVVPTNHELPRGLDESVVDTLPKFAYSSSSDVKVMMGQGECGVCLGTFMKDEILRLLPKCGHVFHADCVDPWLQSHATCPLCRSCLLPEYLPGEMASRAEYRVNIH